MEEIKKNSAKFKLIVVGAGVLLIIFFRIFGSGAQSQPATGESSPQFKAIQLYLQTHLNDPSSLSIDSYSALQSLAGGLSAMRVKYRAKNAFNALILKDQVFTLDARNKVIMVTDFK